MPKAAARDGWYRWYVLFVLVLVYAFNYVDRQIVTILAPALKADLHITDAQIGLLFGTSFALFYGLFGLPLARLADGWSRARTLALGLSFWSLMTASSGLAANFGQLGAARIGVGIGEASATPAAVSLLGDYFERRWRGSILAIYSVGVYIGAGASLVIGGSVLAAWHTHYPREADAPFGLAGWQAAFMTVGIPGLLMALLILLTVREPLRGGREDHPQADTPSPVANAWRELGAMVPPWNLLQLRAAGNAKGEIARNLIVLCVTVAAIIVVTAATNGLLPPAHRKLLGTFLGVTITSNLIQWVAIGFAAYACASWFQAQRLRDPATHCLITGSATFRALTISGGFLAFSMNAVNGFVVVHANRYLGLPAQAGLKLGIIAVIAGGIGVSLGGFLSDHARRLHPSGRLYFVCGTATLFTLASLTQYMTSNTPIFFTAYAVATLFVPMWFGPLQATTQDLVVPRLRGTAFAVFSLGANIFGLGLGPYTAGLISDVTGNLRLGIICTLAVLPITLATLIYAARRLPHDEAVTRNLILNRSGENRDPTGNAG